MRHLPYFMLILSAASQAVPMDPTWPKKKIAVDVPDACAEVSKDRLTMPSQQDLAELKKLNIPAPKRTLKQIDTQYITRWRNDYSQIDSETSHEQVFYTHDGLTWICDAESRYRSSQLSYGIMSLSLYDADSATSTSVNQLSFRGDWRNLPVGQTITTSYVETKVFYKNDASKSIAHEQKDNVQYTCSIKTQVEAKSLHHSLQGTAKLLECYWEGKFKVNAGIGRLYYLTDYGIAVIAGGIRLDRELIGKIDSVKL